MLERLLSAGRQMQESSACDAELPHGPMEPVGTCGGGPVVFGNNGGIENFLKIHAPGSVPSTGGSKTWGASSVLDLNRVRRVDIDWIPERDNVERPGVRDLDYLRWDIERHWRRSSDGFTSIDPSLHEDPSKFFRVPFPGGTAVRLTKAESGQLEVIRDAISVGESGQRFFGLYRKAGVRKPTSWHDFSYAVELFKSRRPSQDDESGNSKIEGENSDSNSEKVSDPRAKEDMNPENFVSSRDVTSSIGRAINDVLKRYDFDDFAKNVLQGLAKLRQALKQNGARLGVASNRIEIASLVRHLERKIGIGPLYKDAKTRGRDHIAVTGALPAGGVFSGKTFWSHAPLTNTTGVEAIPKWEANKLTHCQPLAKDEVIVESLGRFWRLEIDWSTIAATGNPFDDHRSDIQNRWSDLWDKGAIKGLERVAWSSGDNDATRKHGIPFTHLLEEDARPSLIVREYARIESEWKRAKGRRTALSTVLAMTPQDANGNPDMTVQAWSEWDALSESLTQDYDSYLSQVLKLKQEAADLGYLLPIGEMAPDGKAADSTYNTPDGKSHKLVEGRLYKFRDAYQTLKRDQIKTYFDPLSSGAGAILGSAIAGSVGGAIGGLFGGRRKRRRPVYYKVRYSQPYEVKPGFEPWREIRDDLEEEGFECHLMDDASNSLVSAQGDQLADLMARCRVDEEFRSKLALFIPLKEVRFTGNSETVKYLIIVAPEPGLIPSRTPNVLFNESYTYSSEWKGVELGPAVGSIALAPGEKRTISVRSSTSERSEQTRQVSTVLDIVRTEKSSFEGSFERTLRNETEKRKKSNWNAEASGSYGGFIKGSAGGGGSSERSAKSFAETVRKSASAAAREMKEQRKQTIETSDKAELNTEFNEQTDATIENVNPGRTLNVVFHELTNIYEASLILDDLSFTYVSSHDLIEGIESPHIETFAINQLPELIEFIANDRLYAEGELLHDQKAIRRNVLRSLWQAIEREYLGIEGEKGNKGHSIGGLTFDLGDIQSLLEHFGLLRKDEGDRSPLEYSEELRAFQGLMDNLSATGHKIQTHRLAIPSEAVYADAVIGIGPATENYAERMREREVRLRDAEINTRYALADLASANNRNGKNPVALGRIVSSRRIEVSQASRFQSGDWLLMGPRGVIGSGTVSEPANRFTVRVRPDAAAFDKDEILALAHVSGREAIPVRMHLIEG